MSTLPHEAASSDTPLANLLFDYPGADVILRSHDSYYFRVPKIYIINSSAILGELIRTTLDVSPGDENPESFPVVQIPESGEIFLGLLTFIFPVSPLLPSTPEEAMELLSVAQKYQMGTALTHIRGSMSRQNLLPTRLEPALHIYSLAQKYGLQPEVLQAARTILNYPMTTEVFENKFDIMPSAFLYELWKYHERVRDILVSDLTEFRESCARGTIRDLRCTELSSSQIPSWLDHYIESMGKSPDLFDYAEFNISIARHTKDKAGDVNCKCASIPSQTIRDFWEALGSVVNGSFEKVGAVDILNRIDRVLNLLQAESALSLVQEKEDTQGHTKLTSSFEPFDLPDANLIIRSSDLVDFQVHKSVLAIVSPFFGDLLSLPQPSDGEYVDGRPVVQLSEDSELLSSLVSVIYPVRAVVPKSYDKVLYCSRLVSVIPNFFTRCCISSRHVRSTKWLQYNRLSVTRSSLGYFQHLWEPRPSLRMRLQGKEGLFQKWRMQPIKP